MRKQIGLLFYMFSRDLLGCWSLETKKFEITPSLPCHVFRNNKQFPSLLNLRILWKSVFVLNRWRSSSNFLSLKSVNVLNESSLHI